MSMRPPQACPQGSTSYTIKRGDTLYLIAQRLGTTVAALTALNPNINPAALQIGQVICVPGAAPTGATTYTVQPGDTLYLLAQRYGTTVSALQAANNLTSDVIYAGQTLVISGATTPAPPPVPIPETMTYTVQPGDTLYRIARTFGITLDELRRLNNLQGDIIYAGQTLLVPVPSVPSGYTVVRAGDTLFTIAERFGTTIAELKRLNDLTSDTIYVGQVMRVR